MGRQPGPWKLYQKATGVYHVRFTHDGHRYERSTRSRRIGEAQARARQIYVEITTSQPDPPPPDEHPLDAAVAAWLVHRADVERKSPEWCATCRGYAVAHWLPRWRTVEQIDGSAVDGYIAERLRGEGPDTSHGNRPRKTSPPSLRKELSALRSLLRYCKRYGMVDTIPAWDAPQGASDYRGEPLTPAEVEAFIAALDDEHARCWYRVMWATGFRRATMAKLQWSDIDLEQGVIGVRASADKRQYARLQPIDDDAIAALRAWKGDEEKTGPVFRDVQYRTDRKPVKQALERAGLTGRVLPSMTIRTARATHLASETQDIGSVMYLMGHKRLETTSRYVNPGFDKAQSLIRSLNRSSGANSGAERDEDKEKGAPKDA